jgi:penicillin-binding protein 1A
VSLIKAIDGLPQSSALLTHNLGLFDAIGEENRISVTLPDVAPSVITALVATEDRRFFYHHGFDPRGILRAARANLRAGRFVQGGSTLTQQLARMTVLGRADRTIARKLLELCVAILLECCFAKNHILEAYLNAAYFGHNIHGIELAALTFCGKRAVDLDEIEAAYLIGLLRAPARYCHCCNASRAIARTQLVTQLAGFQSRAASRFKFPKALRRRPRYAELFPLTASYATEYVRRWLKRDLPKLYPSRRLIVHTTLDPKCQSAIEATCAEMRSRGYSGRLACLVLDAKSGAVRGMSGGVTFRTHQFNSATDGFLQPGSLLKPFILLAAIQKGFSVDRKFESRPLTVELRPGASWQVGNAGNKYYGPITLAEALVHSDNTVYAQLLLDVGVEPVLAILRLAGLPVQRATPALSAGAIRPGVSPLQICGAYSVFSNCGTFVPTVLIERVVEETGRCLWENRSTARRLCTSDQALMITEILRRVYQEGTGILPFAQAGLAAKTGTSISGGWYMSFSDTYRVLTWTESDFMPVGVTQNPEKAVSAKMLANRIWSLLAKPQLTFSDLWGSFAGIDSMSVRDLLWIEGEFQKP